MKNKYKPQALLFREGDDGMFTLHCGTIQEAFNQMQKTANSEYSSGDPVVVRFEKIKQTRMYECKACNFYNIDEPICCMCGDTELSPRGRKTFVYYF